MADIIELNPSKIDYKTVLENSYISADYWGGIRAGQFALSNEYYSDEDLVKILYLLSKSYYEVKEYDYALFYAKWLFSIDESVDDINVVVLNSLMNLRIVNRNHFYEYSNGSALDSVSGLCTLKQKKQMIDDIFDDDNSVDLEQDTDGMLSIVSNKSILKRGHEKTMTLLKDEKFEEAVEHSRLILNRFPKSEIAVIDHVIALVGMDEYVRARAVLDTLLSFESIATLAALRYFAIVMSLEGGESAAFGTLSIPTIVRLLDICDVDEYVNLEAMIELLLGSNIFADSANLKIIEDFLARRNLSKNNHFYIFTQASLAKKRGDFDAAIEWLKSMRTLYGTRSHAEYMLLSIEASANELKSLSKDKFDIASRHIKDRNMYFLDESLIVLKTIAALDSDELVEYHACFGNYFALLEYIIMLSDADDVEIVADIAKVLDRIPDGFVIINEQGFRKLLFESNVIEEIKALINYRIWLIDPWAKVSYYDDEILYEESLLMEEYADIDNYDNSPIAMCFLDEKFCSKRCADKIQRAVARGYAIYEYFAESGHIEFFDFALSLIIKRLIRTPNQFSDIPAVSAIINILALTFGEDATIENVASSSCASVEIVRAYLDKLYPKSDWFSIKKYYSKMSEDIKDIYSGEYDRKLMMEDFLSLIERIGGDPHDEDTIAALDKFTHNIDFFRQLESESDDDSDNSDDETDE